MRAGHLQMDKKERKDNFQEDKESGNQHFIVADAEKGRKLSCGAISFVSSLKALMAFSLFCGGEKKGFFAPVIKIIAAAARAQSYFSLRKSSRLMR
jgi:hypothetical protein